MAKRKGKFVEYIIQLSIVIIGVFLGMLVSDWNADQKLDKNKKAVLHSIKTEMENNKASLEENWKNRNPFFKSLDSLNSTLLEEIRRERFFDRSWAERLPNWKGFGRGQLNNSMFETAKYSNVLSAMDVSLLQQISKTYNAQETALAIRKTLMNKFFDIDTNTEYSDVIALMWRIRQELGGAEYLLSKEYDICIEMIEEQEL